jgi:hypothetical protein
MYQTDPKFDQEDNVMSLAWFAKTAHPDTKVNFEWDVDYSFVWSETGELKPGVVFEASQVLSADLNNSNAAVFDYDSNAFLFEAPISNGKAGSLQISETGNIPFDTAAVGIGMSGAGTFVKPAQPNKKLKFTPHPVYWITSGTFEQGEVLDIEELTNSQKLVFAPNQYSITVILQEDNTWKIA